MNKREFARAVAAKVGGEEKDILPVINAYHSVITETLQKGETVFFMNFGSYFPKTTKERVGRNPATGVEIKLTPTVIAKFKAGKSLKAALN